jgi:CheY-like chemotaxis protein
VLIVEDEEDLLDVASELFRNMGYEVLTASNGADALEVLERNPGIDVLFSDVMMPGMSGLELARVARRLYPETRIVLASGYPVPVLRAEQGDIDEFTFIGKPYRLSEIARRLR